MKIKETAAEYAKKHGLKSLNQVTKMIDVSPNTLNNWKNDKPKLFHAVVSHCSNPDALLHIDILKNKLRQHGVNI